MIMPKMQGNLLKKKGMNEQRLIVVEDSDAELEEVSNLSSRLEPGMHGQAYDYLDQSKRHTSLAKQKTFMPRNH